MLKYLIYVIVNIPFDIFCYIFNPIIMLFAQNDNLPKWLSWCQTQDSPLDNDFIKSLFPKYPSDSRFDKYMRGLLWLYRNTGYSFAYDILGVNLDVNSSNIITRQLTDNLILYYDKSKPWYSRPFDLKGIIPYGKFYCQLYLGWKFYTAKVNGSDKCMLAMNVNPFKRK